MNAVTYPVVILCIILPAVSSLFVRRREGVGTDDSRVRLLDRAGKMQWWHDLPGYMTWNIAPGQIGWVLSFLLWFPGFQRVCAAVRPDLATPYPRETAKRAATLVSRNRCSPLTRGHWGMGWTIYLFGAGLVVAGLATGDGAPATTLSAGLMILFAPLSLVITPWGIRMVLREPEPLAPGDSAELARAYDRHRDKKIRGFWMFALLMTAMFAGLAVATAWGARGETLGWVGGIGGSLIGVAGGVFGVVMGVDRARIKTMLDASAAESGRTSVETGGTI
jgi:hypothetical protein